MRTRNIFNLRSRLSEVAKFRPRNYQYESLPSSTSIRLLELTPSAKSKAIYCSLKVFELQDAPAFDALSYTWAPIVSSKVSTTEPQYNDPENGISGRQCRYPITCDGQSILVTANLRNALQMLSKSIVAKREVTKQKYIWIDALCVNQEDITERNAQVANMAETFKAAQSVIVWLGEEDEFTADAVKVIEQISAIPETEWQSAGYTDFYKDDCYRKLQVQHLSYLNWLGFIAFVNRPWFKRAWVVQEIALAKSALLVCGRRVFPWDQLSKTLAFIKSTRWYHHLTTEKMRHISALENAPGAYKRILSTSADIAMAAMYLDRTRAHIATSGRLTPQSQNRQRKPSLRLLLETHRYCKSTDARDKVYAFLGLADRRLAPFKELPNALVPDYSMTAQELYLQVARAFLVSYGNLTLLSHVQDQSHTRIPNLPSWVPDYSVGLQPYPLRFRGACNWSASGDLYWKRNLRSMERGYLHVQGYQIDTIDEISTLRDESKDAADSWASCVRLALGLDDYYRTTSSDMRQLSRVEVLWRTLITDSFARQYPAPAHCGELFIDYIINLQIRHRLTPWSSDIEFQPHHSPLSKSTYPEWHALLSSEPEGSPYGVQLYERRLSEIVASMFKGTYSPIGLAQLQHEFDIAGGSMRRLFKTKNKYLGTGARSTQVGDELWVLAGAPVPFILRRLPRGTHQVVGEAYVHSIMHGEAAGMGLKLCSTALE
ncbi:hypothetical protein AOQ84DRAFT_305531 [Glonium stellatum]|uniref:Heterokaryon incompatibility domain-containing protein n=1 Tax=Glonium stellatum TaxID=574774 RepID=A0A8E2JLV4_9PEZI|nr:hypothetical protein AOQ84DRAFT_305531 [Glonium stellatum]